MTGCDGRATRRRNKKLTERVAELEAQVGLLSGDSKKADDAARKFVAMGDKLREVGWRNLIRFAVI